MTHALPAESHIVVVDARPRDYRDLPSLAEEHKWHVHFLTTARAAVTFVRRARASLWMINTRLPDMPGLALYEILRDQVAGATAFLISDHYEAEYEQLACQMGAALYLCKEPAHTLDCRSILQSLVTHSPRAGPGPPQDPARRLDRSKS